MTRWCAVAAFVVCLTPAAALAQFVIKDDATGGDCQGKLKARWNAKTKTCTLNAKFTGTIDIVDDGLTLNGFRRTITAPNNPGWGVRLDGRQNVEVVDVLLKGFKQGILVQGGSGNRITANVVSSGIDRGQGCGICLKDTQHNTLTFNQLIENLGPGFSFSSAHHNTLQRNTVRKNGLADFYMIASDHNRIEHNTITGDPKIQSQGVQMRGGTQNTFVYNRVVDHRWNGFWFWRSRDNLLKFNTVANNGWDGYSGQQAQSNKIVCNDFSGHGLAIDLTQGAGGHEIWFNNMYVADSASEQAGAGAPNTFNKPLPIGGNYWQVHAPKCMDNNKDGFCDAPYGFAGNRDNLPHVKPIPWKQRPEICDPPAPAEPGIDVISLWDRWVTGHDSESPQALRELLAANVVLAMGTGADVAGPAAFVERYRAAFPSGKTMPVLGDVDIIGDWAFMRGSVVESVAAGRRERARFVMLWRREPTGDWRVVRFVAYAEPAAPP